MKDVALSKKLSYLLRHNPEQLDLQLDDHGFTSVKISEIAKRLDVSEKQIRRVVQKDEKKRFTLKDGHIRANYGHSIDLGKTMIQNQKPATDNELPEFLYHGTARKHVNSIMDKGLLPQSRKFVHLSFSPEWATKVGKRHDHQPVIIKVDVKNAKENGNKFWIVGPTTVLSTEISAEHLVIE